MADESIVDLLKPGFPITEKTAKSNKVTLEYIGLTSTLESAEPAQNATWGDYPGFVASTRLEPTENEDWSTLTVTVEETFDLGESGGSTPGTAAEVTYEIEWQSFTRSLYEHPAFRKGGGGQYELNSTDIQAIKAWQNETDVNAKANFQFREEPQGVLLDLYENAKMFAEGLNLGQETYEDFAPVARITTTYVNGLPATTTAGLKADQPTFAGIPTGYEWRKSADRAVRQGKNGKWDRVEEWIGAKKVLTDRDNVYWTPPA